VDDNSRVGVEVSGSITDTRTQDGYRVIAENSVVPLQTYTKYSTVAGGSSSFQNQANVTGAPDGVYSSINTGIVERWYYAENEASDSNSTGAWKDRTTLTFTATAANYLIIAGAFINVSNTTDNASVSMLLDGSVIAEENFRAQGAGADTYFTFATHRLVSLAAGTHSLVLRYKDDPGTGTVYIKNARIFAMKVSSGTVTAENESVGTTTSTTPVNRTTLSFTSAADNYLVLGSAELRNTATANASYVQLTQTTTSQGQMNKKQYGSADHWYSYVAPRIFDLPGANQDFRIQYWAGVGTAEVRRARVTAAKMSDLGALVVTAENEGYDSTTSTTWVDRVTATFTSTDDNYLVIGYALVGTDQNAAGDIVYAQLDYGAAASADNMWYRPSYATAPLDNIPFFSVRKLSLTAGSQVFKIQYRVGTGGNTGYIRNARILAIKLPLGAAGASDNDNIYAEGFDNNETGTISQVTLKMVYKVSAASTDDNFVIKYTLDNVNFGATTYSFTPTFTTDTTVSVDVTSDRTWTWENIGRLRIWCFYDQVGTADGWIGYIDALYVEIITGTPQYYLRWQHTIENVDPGWENLDNLTTAEKTITKTIPSSQLSNYLRGDNILIKYESWDNTDSTQTTVYIDLCIVQQENVYSTSISVYARASSDGSIWTAWEGPYPTPGGSTIGLGDNRYIQYKAEFTSEDNTLTPLLDWVKIRYS
jgi:hypothetical protein